MRNRGLVAVVALAVLLALAAAAGAQSNVSGSIRGAVRNAEGGPLPGVTVTLTSEALVTRTATTATDAQGAYRFPSLPPGVYAVAAALDGFQPARFDDVRVSLGGTLSVDFTLKLESFTDEITVAAEAPIVSVVDNTVAGNLSSEYLDRQPLPRDVNSLVNYVPGVNNGRAYGSTEERTLAFNLDGVNVANPASGEHWALTNPDWVTEIQVVGLGAPAEYGGFTGAAFNLVTKSGANTPTGDAVVYYTGADLESRNAPAGSEGSALLPSETDSDWDVSVNIGGPVTRERLWYFASVQFTQRDVTPYYRSTAPLDEQLDQQDIKHRYMVKMTYQASPRDRLVGMVFYDDRYFDRRAAGATRLASASEKQESPNWEYNATWDSLVNDSNFLSLKLTGFRGRDDRLPYGGEDKRGRTDDTTGFGWDNRSFTLKQLVERWTLDGSWNLFREGLLGGGDSHAFKFGVNYEYGHYDQEQTRNAGFTYYDRSSRCPSLDGYFADPSCGAYSSDQGNEILLDAVQRGINAYAQDSLRFSRLTVNVGLRFTHYEAGFTDGDEDVYAVDLVAPRIGAVYDVFGNGRTAVKAHYGRYYLGMFAYLYDREVSGEAYTPYEIWDYNPVTKQYDKLVRRTLTTATLDSGIDHPYTDQYVASIEQQLGRDVSVGLDYVHRKDSDIIVMTDTSDAYTYAEVPGNPITGGTLPVYDLQTPPVFVLTAPPTAYREFDSVTLRLNKRYARGWMLRASVVWSDLQGNALKNNSYVPEWQYKNTLVNADGTLENFSEWEFKLYASVDLPWGIEASGNYTFLAGEFWTPYVRMSGLKSNTSTNVNLTERGTEQLEDRQLVDVRLSKDFALGAGLRLSVFADAFNLLNKNTALSVDGRWGTLNYRASNPAASTWSSRTAYTAPLSMESPRQVRLGLRLSF